MEDPILAELLEKISLAKQELATYKETAKKIQFLMAEKISDLERTASRVVRKERSKTISTALAQIFEYGLTAQELGLCPKTKPILNRSASESVKIKPSIFCNRAGSTWVFGQGPKPDWIVEALAAGQSLRQFVQNKNTASNHIGEQNVFNRQT